MKESIQQNGEEVAIVIYDAPLPPKYFRLTKRFIRTLFTIVPILLVILTAGIITWGLGNRVKEVPTPTLPSVLSESDGKVQELESELQSLRDSHRELTDKLHSLPSQPTAEDPFLMMIKRPYGMQNLMAENKVMLDQFQLIQDANKTSLKFVIISSTPETKVTGHVLVFMISEAGVMGYPKDTNSALAEGVKYSAGEPFSVSRLRPTNAEFLHRLGGESVKFMIYIFNREGDLLLIKQTDSFKVGAKS